MNKGLAFFLAKILSNKTGDLFFVRLGTTLVLNKFGITGPLAKPIGFFVRGLLGLLVDEGTFLIGVSMDAYREGQKLEEFKIAAKEAYDKASAKLYTEEEKEKIRQEYLGIISRIGVVGS
jgi:hypothetical protein